jgi:hypothetical protein
LILVFSYNNNTVVADQVGAAQRADEIVNLPLNEDENGRDNDNENEEE